MLVFTSDVGCRRQRKTCPEVGALGDVRNSVRGCAKISQGESGAQDRIYAKRHLLYRSIWKLKSHEDAGQEYEISGISERIDQCAT